MTAHIQPQHDLSAIEIDAIDDRFYAYNREAVGRDDAKGLGFVIRDDAGRIVGVADWIFLGRHFRTQTDVDR